MAKRCAGLLLWRLVTELILNFQPTDANMRLAPGDMISIDPAVIRFLQESRSSKARVLGSLSAHKTTSPERPLTAFNLPQYASPFISILAYTEVSFPTYSAIYVRHPTARPTSGTSTDNSSLDIVLEIDVDDC
jgi:hypothetical protein